MGGGCQLCDAFHNIFKKKFLTRAGGELDAPVETDQTIVKEEPNLAPDVVLHIDKGSDEYTDIVHVLVDADPNIVKNPDMDNEVLDEESEEDNDIDTKTKQMMLISLSL
jgi:hypothetical protein